MSITPSVTVDHVANQVGADLIDVRTPLEYREVHAVNAKNIPLDSLDPRSIMNDRNGDSNEPLYVICKSGGRSSKAQQRFINAGFSNVINVEGGTDAWMAGGFEVVRGKKAISLERQVRIAAGMIVLTGAAVTILTQNVNFALIPGFVGAGLIFAGLTDTCAMGMLIAKMPWNQVVAGTSSQCHTPSGTSSGSRANNREVGEKGCNEGT